jgi:hypothetical protein
MKSLSCLLLPAWLSAKTIEAFSVFPGRRTTVCSPFYSPCTLLRAEEYSDEEGEMYNDFQDFDIVGESSVVLPGLQSRMDQVVQEQEAKQSITSNNWKTGNWAVRGFSLVPYSGKDDNHNDDPDNEETRRDKITVSCLVLTNHADYVLCGRTNGSVVVVQLGTEYLASFTNQLTAKEAGDDASIIQISQNMKRQEQEAQVAAAANSGTDSFKILLQYPAAEHSITHMLLHQEEDEEDMLILFTSDAVMGTIQQWKIDMDDTTTTSTMTPLNTTMELHTAPLVALMSWHPAKDQSSSVLSVDLDGMVGVWEMATGKLQFFWQMPTEYGSVVSSHVHTDDDDDGKYSMLYIGTSEGKVLIYNLDEIVHSTEDQGGVEQPLKAFQAYSDQSAVTAIASSGQGTLGRNGVDSLAMVTASANGVVKQWELLTKKGYEDKISMEHWPRMANQKLKDKAHLLPNRGESPIFALASLEDHKICAATQDGQLVVWNGVGEVLFEMDGFDFTSVPASICSTSQLLISNGMEQYVCVHDFDVSEDEAKDGYDLEW